MPSKLRKLIAVYGSLEAIPLGKLQDLSKEDQEWLEKQVKSRTKRMIRNVKGNHDG